MEEKLLMHVGTYQKIYEYLAKSSHTLDEIKEYLKSQGMNASTVNSQLGKLKGENTGMLRVNGDMVSIDTKAAREFVGEINEIFAPITNVSSEDLQELKESREENEKLKRQLTNCKKKVIEKTKLDEKRLEAAKHALPKVLLTDSVQVGPIESIQDAVFLNPNVVPIDVQAYLQKYGSLRESFYRELDQLKELSKGHYRRKTFREVLAEGHITSRLAELKQVKEALPSGSIPVMKEIKKKLHVSEKEADMQLKYLSGRALSVQEILENPKLTNQEKLALYAFHSPYRGTDMERLLNEAGDECVDAAWLITLLESPDVCNNYENVKNLIRQCSKASEWAMKQRLAEELIAGDWYVKANYGGVETKFQLVPVEELNRILNAIGLDQKDFEQAQSEAEPEPVEVENAEEASPVWEKKNDDGVPADSGWPKKGDFVPTYTSDDIEPAEPKTEKKEEN